MYPVDPIRGDVDRVLWRNQGVDSLVDTLCSVSGRHRGHDVNRVHMTPGSNSWGAAICFWEFLSVSGRHCGHDVDRIHRVSWD